MRKSIALRPFDQDCEILFMRAVFPQEFTLKLRMRLDILKERDSWMINSLDTLMWSNTEYCKENLSHHVVKGPLLATKEGLKKPVKQMTVHLNNIVDARIVHIENGPYCLFEENRTPERINAWLSTTEKIVVDESLYPWICLQVFEMLLCNFNAAV